MLDCFNYTPMTRDEVIEKFFLKPEIVKSAKYEKNDLVTYQDTECFALSKVVCEEYSLKEKSFVTVCMLSDSGYIVIDGEKTEFKRGDKFFVPYNTEVKFLNCEFLICYPPEKSL